MAFLVSSLLVSRSRIVYSKAFAYVIGALTAPMGGELGYFEANAKALKAIVDGGLSTPVKRQDIPTADAAPSVTEDGPSMKVGKQRQKQATSLRYHDEFLLCNARVTYGLCEMSLFSLLKLMSWRGSQCLASNARSGLGVWHWGGRRI